MDEIIWVVKLIFAFFFWVISSIAELAYIFLDLFPDVIKWIIIIGIFVAMIIDDEHPVLRKVIGVVYFYFMVRAYVEQEGVELEDTSFKGIASHLLDMAVNIYEYFANNPFFLFLGVVFVVVLFKVATEESVSEPDYDYDEGGFSPREQAAFDAANKIKEIKRYL